MSTEAGRSDRRRVVRYRRLLAVTVTLLAVLVAGLTIANAFQGPRLAAAELDGQAAIARPAQNLVLRTHQRIRPVTAGDVRVEPATAVSVSSDESTVTVRFEELLAYATDYSVTVDATTAATGSRSTLRYTFRTPDTAVFSLARQGGGQDDRILRRQVGSGDMAEVLAAPAIQEYAVVGDLLAFATIESDRTNRLWTKPVAGGPESEILLPAAGTVTQLAASSASSLLGYIFTPEGSAESGARPTLIIHDAESRSGGGREVLGPDGEPLPVLDWAFVPSTTSVVAQADDLNLYLVDVLGGDPPVPLGQHQELRNFIPGTRTLTVANANGPTAIDLTTGDNSPLPLPSDEATAADSAGDVIILGKGRYVEVLMTPEYGPGFTRLNPRIMHVDDSGPRLLYEPPTEETDIRAICVSPNGRQLAVELLPGRRQPDGYPNVPASLGMSIVIVDVKTGATVGEMNGFQPSWC